MIYYGKLSLVVDLNWQQFNRAIARTTSLLQKVNVTIYRMKGVKSNQLKKLRQDSPKMMEAIRKEAIKYQFLVGSHYSVKLRRSLTFVDRLELVDKTLWSTKIHKVHSSRLADQYIRKWKKIKTAWLNKWSSLPSKIRKGVSKPTDNEIA